MEISKPARFTKLDGLRGILSIIVALNHSYMIVAIPAIANIWGKNIFEPTDIQSKLQQIFMLLGNGGVAVTMFFVLSGLVMGQSLSRISPNIKGVLSFYAKRLTRLYPAYFFLIVFSALYMSIGFEYEVYPAANPWFLWWNNFQMTLPEFFRNALFISISLGGITWTLRVIVIASLLFPLFTFLTKKTPWYVDIIFSIALIILSFTLLDLPNFRDLRYVYMFFLGLTIPKFRYFFERIPNWFVMVTLPVCLFILFNLRYLTEQYVGGLGESIVSWFYIGVMAYGSLVKVFDFLDAKILEFYGRISYSLYLIHFSVLYILAKYMFEYLPNLPYTQHYFSIHTIIFALSLVLATGLSMLINKYIEDPSMKLANAISERMKK